MGYHWLTIINIQLIVDILSFIFRWIGHFKSFNWVVDRHF